MTTPSIFTQAAEPLQDMHLQDFVVAEDTLEQPAANIHNAVRDILYEIGEDPTRQGLLKTPDRVQRMYAELTAGYRTDPVELVNGALFDVEYSDLVLVKDIEFYSLCEHHLLPFYGRAHVAYIPDGKVIGLSKIPRIVEMFARRLQVQERMTAEIAHLLDELLKPQGVAVVVEGAHMCSMMRGVKQAEASMTTRTLLGKFQEDPQLRTELFAHIAKNTAN